MVIRCNTEKKIELLDYFRNKTSLEIEAYLGKEAKLKIRLIAKKLPKELSEGRRRKANKLAKSWQIFAIKDRYRKKRISTLQMLKLSIIHP